MLRLEPIFTLDLKQPLEQVRSAPVRLSDGTNAILLAYSADYDVDPYSEMFFYPTDTLKLALVTLSGEVLWRRDLGRGTPPGMWFCPLLPFDLDGDGDDEIWLVTNVDMQHPLSIRGRRLQRLDPRTGEVTGEWEWPGWQRRMNQPMSQAFREFLIAGHVHGKPVLVTAQGTYGLMTLQGWDAGMTPRWSISIEAGTPGARGSHMCPVVDINNDGIDELMWGERCISLDDGHELFCCDRESWGGHSDMVQPVLDRTSGQWRLFTFRETAAEGPRVVMFDNQGRREWGDVERGHMDMGWVATLDDGGPIGTSIRIDAKTSGPGGHGHPGREEFAFRVLTGKRVPLGFDTYKTVPVDLNGDGRHELVRGLYQGDGAVHDGKGQIIGNIGGRVSSLGKFGDFPGEQVLTFREDGVVRLMADRDAKDSDAALARFTHPFYRGMRRLTATGFNIHALGGV